MKKTIRASLMGLMVLALHAGDAAAQLRDPNAPSATLQAETLGLPGWRVGPVDLLPASATSLASAARAPQAPPPCRRGRRAWIGALIGAGASVPLALLAHTRFENEAADGTAAAATTVALAAAAGAFIALSTCG